MGLDGVNKFLQDKYGHVYNSIPIRNFVFKKIAWDVSSHIYKFMHAQGADNSKWLNPFINILLFFRKNCVNVVPVFDGKAPPEKDEERTDRSEQKDKSDEKCFNLRLDLQRFKTDGIRSTELVKFAKQLKIKELNKQVLTKFKSLLRPKPENNTEEKSGIIGDDIKIDVNLIESEIEQRERNLFSVKPEDIALLKNLLDILKIPYFQAPDEAEAFCCDLCKRGLVEAVFSFDSDCIAHLAPIIINDINQQTGECQVLRVNDLLEEMKITPQQLQLFAVLVGTDYNRKVKNVSGLGPVGALKLVKEYKTFEAIESSDKIKAKNPEQPIMFRYKRSIELFNLTYSNITLVPWWNLHVDFEAVEKFTRQHELRCNIDIMKNLWKPPKVIFEDESETF